MLPRFVTLAELVSQSVLNRSVYLKVKRGTHASTSAGATASQISGVLVVFRDLYNQALNDIAEAAAMWGRLYGKVSHATAAARAPS